LTISAPRGEPAFDLPGLPLCVTTTSFDLFAVGAVALEFASAELDCQYHQMKAPAYRAKT
jgi:hypothetical protein